MAPAVPSPSLLPWSLLRRGPAELCRLALLPALLLLGAFMILQPAAAQPASGELGRCTDSDPGLAGRHDRDLHCRGPDPLLPSATVPLPDATVPTLPPTVVTPPHCDSHQRVEGTGCVDRCPSSQRWTGSRCVRRCSRYTTWNGHRCVTTACPVPLFWHSESCYCSCGKTMVRGADGRGWICVSRCSDDEVWQPARAPWGQIPGCEGRCRPRCTEGVSWNSLHNQCGGEGWGDG